MTDQTRFFNPNSLAGGDGTTPATTGVNRAYSSQNEMEAAEQSTTAGDTFTGIGAGGLDNTPVIYAGWDPTVPITITSSDFPAGGVFDDTKYHLDVGESAPTGLEIQEDNFNVFLMQFQRQSIAVSSVARTCIRVNLVGAGSINIDFNYFKSIGQDTAGVQSAVSFDDSSPTYSFTSNIVEGFNGATHQGIGGIGASAAIDVYNNTLIDNTTAINSRANYLAKNNIFQDNGTDIGGTVNSSNDYNLTDNVSIPGANSVANSTLTFENKASDNFALVVGDTDAIGAGIGPSADANVPLTDIIGTARSGAATDIGAFVFVGGGSGVTVTADTGTYLYTGADASLLVSRIMQASSGSYNYTGTSINLLKGFVLTAQSGSYSYLGQDATLTYTPVGANILIADSGSYALTGTNINFNRDRVMIASSGSYLYQGTDIQITLPGQIWTDKPSVATNWTNQTNVTTIWTDK